MSDAFTDSTPDPFLTGSAEDSHPSQPEETAAPKRRNSRRSDKPRSSARTARPSNRLTRAQVTALLGKYEQVANLDDEQSRFLAASLGLPADSSAELIVAEVYTSSKNTNPVALVDTLRQVTDPVERYISALSLSKDESKAVWNLLTGVTDEDGKLPADERRAAKRIIDALNKVDELTLMMLGELKELGSR